MANELMILTDPRTGIVFGGGGGFGLQLDDEVTFALIFYADCRGEFITTSPHTMGTPSFDIPRGYAAEARSLRQNKKKANNSKNKANISIANAIPRALTRCRHLVGT